MSMKTILVDAISGLFFKGGTIFVKIRCNLYVEIASRSLSSACRKELYGTNWDEMASTMADNI